MLFRSSDRTGYKIKNEVRKILHCFGETTVERDVWAKLQSQENPIDRYQLFEFQASYGQELDVIDKLVNDLKYVYREKIDGVISALSHIGNSHPQIEQKLIYLLKDDDYSIRFKAVLAVDRLGNISYDVEKILLSLLDDQCSDVKNRALSALVHNEKISCRVEDILSSWLADENPDIRYSAASSLLLSGKGSPFIEEVLVSLLEKGHLVVRYNAASLLIHIEEFSHKAEGVLRSLLVSQNTAVRYNTVSLLIRIGKFSPDVETALLSLLLDTNLQVKLNAVSALVKIGNTSGTEELLWPLLRDKSPHVRNRAALILSQLSQKLDTILPKVMQWLEQNQDENVMGGAIDCLYSIVVE